MIFFESANLFGSSIRPSPASLCLWSDSDRPVPRLFSLLLVQQRAEVARVHGIAAMRQRKIAGRRCIPLSFSLLDTGGSSGRLRVVVIFRFALTGFVLLVLHLVGHHTRCHPPRLTSRDSTAGEILREIEARLEHRTSRPDTILRRRKREDAAALVLYFTELFKVLGRDSIASSIQCFPLCGDSLSIC